MSFGTCTWSLVVVALLALASGFLLLIVFLGHRRLLRETKRTSLLAQISPMPLFRPKGFGEIHETPRRRLASLFGLAVMLLSILLLSSAVLSVTCRA